MGIAPCRWLPECSIVRCYFIIERVTTCLDNMFWNISEVNEPWRLSKHPHFITLIAHRVTSCKQFSEWLNPEVNCNEHNGDGCSTPGNRSACTSRVYCWNYFTYVHEDMTTGVNLFKANSFLGDSSAQVLVCTYVDYCKYTGLFSIVSS